MPRPDNHQSAPPRGSGLDIFVHRAGRFLSTFFGLWILLAGLLTYARIATAETPPLSWQEIVIIVIVSAAITVGIALPIAVGLVEGTPMVLAKLYLDRAREDAREQGVEEGREEGVEIGREQGRVEGREQGVEEGVQIGLARGLREGRQKMLAEWRNWNARRQQAERTGQPFTEPEPGSDDNATPPP